MFRLDNKVAIVTGVGTNGPNVWGIGAAIASVFVRQGASVIGCDVDEQAADATHNLITAEDGQLTIELCDVLEPQQIRKLVGRCLERHGKIDILVNNVGGSTPGGVADLEIAAWNAQLAYNLTSAFLMCKAVIPEMERQEGGSIINISSVAGIRYIGRNHVAYSASKAGLIQMSRSIAVSCASKNIRVNCIVPGLLDTPAVVRIARQTGNRDLEELRRRRSAQVPIKRSGDAWDVAHAAVFLASAEAGYITATELIVDGGLTAATR